MPWKSPRSWRKTVVFTSLSRPLPASSRIARRFAKVSSVSPGRRETCPETKTKSPKRIACEYGAPWNGAGAASVRTTDLSAMCLLSAGRGAGLEERDPERLEDRLEHVLGVTAVH